ncbi:MAG: thioredoxin domain-containing protein [Acidobacteriia bacterium]|nr:thioredoxin domain-containing protein [Terriglobia bacterium]
MRRSLLCCFFIMILLSLAIAQQKSSAKSKDAPPPVPTFSTRLPSEETVNAFMKQMFGYDPAVSWKIAAIRPSQAEGLTEVLVVLSTAQGQQNSRLYVTEDGQHAVIGDIIPFGAHPFTAAQETLSKGMDGPSRGPSDAAVTVVEFSDLQCPHCKEAQPTIDKLMAEEKNARLVFQNFPLPSHDWAAKAAYYGDCIGRSSPDAFWKYVAGVYATQSDITAATADEKLTALAEQAGAKGADTAACAANPETVARVQRSVALGTALEVTGTPTLFINGRKISNVAGLPYEVLKGLTEFAAKEGK